METAVKSVSPGPSSSTSKGFKSVIAKARLGRKEGPSTGSLNGSDESSEQSGVRNSVDSLVDRRHNSVNDGLPSGLNKVSKLIPGLVKKKKIRKRGEAEQLPQELAESRGRSIDDQTATAAEPNAQIDDNESRDTLGEGGEDGGSLISVESDNES